MALSPGAELASRERKLDAAIDRVAGAKLVGVPQMTLAERQRIARELEAQERANNPQLALAAAVHELIDATRSARSAAAPSAPSTSHAITDWIERWIASREARGLSATRDVRAHVRLHIAPVIGENVATWSRADMRRLSAALDAKVQAGEISAKTARNIWGTATRMGKDSHASKIDALVVRDDNPALGVQGPDRKPERARQYLYPSEFRRFMESEGVPLRWRRTVAVATYLGCRDGELRVLEWSDVDLDHGVVHITRAWNRRTKSVKPTKTGHTRRFQIELALLPLLRALHAESGGMGPVVDLASERDMARGFRRCLAVGGVERGELHRASETSQPIRFHDLRATCATWMIVRGDTERRVMARTGHLDRAMVDRYVRVAESVAGTDFGEPFPALPASLLGSAGAEKAEPVRQVKRTGPKSGADGTRTRARATDPA